MPNSTQCGVVVLFPRQTKNKRSDTMFFSYNLVVMHNSLLDFHSTSIGRLKPIKKDLRAMSKKYFTETTKKVADETTQRNSIMESIARCLSLPLPIKRCRKCKEYKRTMANLVQIIQEQNQQLQNLQRQLDFTKAQYLEQNQRLSRTQEKFLCHTCLVNFKKPNTDCELCPQCSQILPK